MHSNHPPPIGPLYPASQVATASQKLQTKRELTQAIGGAHEVLISVATVFPFAFFPDRVTIDRAKLTIAHHSFFKTGEVMSIRIEDILNVTASIGPFLGSLKITTRYFDSDKAYQVDNLARGDVLKLKRILQGYIIALRKQIDCSALTTKELANLLNQLGEGAVDET